MRIVPARSLFLSLSFLVFSIAYSLSISLFLSLSIPLSFFLTSFSLPHFPLLSFFNVIPPLLCLMDVQLLAMKRYGRRDFYILKICTKISIFDEFFNSRTKSFLIKLLIFRIVCTDFVNILCATLNKFITAFGCTQSFCLLVVTRSV